MMDQSSRDLCLIDSGIDNLSDIPLNPQLQSLNLHSNNIRNIENLYLLRHLRHLDLSSNQICRIEGLEGLMSLRTLNLSCNVISVVEGIEHLRSLVKLDLSYNQIEDLSGFQVIQDESYKLSSLDLHGNRIQAVHHVARCLVGCLNLRRVSLMNNGADNPACHKTEYRSILLSALPWLDHLDGVDRQGHVVMGDENILADIPGLDDYLDYLVSNSSSDVNPIALATPQIDAALQMFQLRGATTPEMSMTATDADTSQRESSTHESSNPENSTKQTTPKKKAAPSNITKKLSADHELRIEKLEHQLCQLLYGDKKEQDKPSSTETKTTKSKTKAKPQGAKSSPIRPKVTRHSAKRDIDQTDESDGDFEGSAKGRRQARTPSYQRQTSSSRGQHSTKEHQKISKETVDGSERRRSSPIRHHPKSPATPRVRPVTELPTAIATDEQKRDDLQNTYVQLMQELESERERRWKAEQAAKKLVDYVKDLKSKAEEEHGLQEIAVQATSRLKQALTNEREASTRLQAEVEVLKEEIKVARTNAEDIKVSEENQHVALKTAEETMLKMQREHLQQHTHEAKKIQEFQARAAAAVREVEILRNTVKNQKGQLQQLQELLADREQDHRQALSGRYKLESAEMQDVIKKEVGRVEKVHADELRIQQQRIETVSRQYSELEDEFRLALLIESGRFKELQEAFEEASQDRAENKQALVAALKKEEQSTQVINELTSLVKEQKGRITEMSKSKQEIALEYKDRIQTLEEHVNEARRRMVQFELLKQESTKLRAENQAQMSVIDGLKAERKLWGEELAQQGASLAQDRGRMEAKIETLATEASTLKKQLERESDAVRIKTKLIDDQTETIRKLKEGLVERDQEVRKARDDAIKVQKDLEEQLNAETTANHDLQERLDRVRERKDELKDKVEDLEEQLGQSKKAHGALNNKWKEKSHLISELERQVSQMKDQWQSKEQKLTSERDKAIDAAKIAIDRLKSMDDAFRQQLDKKEEGHQRALQNLADEKQEEIDLANKRVLEVEEEMRELLRETSASKRAMEERFHRLTKAFSDIQQDLT